MTTALYPATIYPLIGYGVEPIFYTQTTPMKSGADVAEKLWDTARYRINLPYRVSATNGATILNFFDSRHGKYEAFDFVDFVSRAWTSVYVGAGTGSLAQFTIPFRFPSSLTVYVDGVAKTFSTHWTYGAGLPAPARTVIEFTIGNEPAAGEVVTIDATGYRYFLVRFDNDQIRYTTTSNFSGNAEMWDFDVTLISQRT